MRARPDFYCLGVQKAGTTWLSENICEHPQVGSALLKEAHYFDNIHYWYKGQDLSSYISHPEFLEPIHKAIAGSINWAQHPEWMVGRTALTSNEWIDLCKTLLQMPFGEEWYDFIFSSVSSEQISGDFTPEYSLLDHEGMDQLLARSPDAKLILLFRDPVERDWSEVRMRLPKGATIEEISTTLQDEVTRSRSRYEEIISKWTAKVNTKRILINFTDEIAQSPESLLVKISMFLGLDPSDCEWPSAQFRIHEGRSESMPEEVRKLAIELNYETLRYMSKEFGGVCTGWLEKY